MVTQARVYASVEASAQESMGRLDDALLPLRADRMACRVMLESLREAIERLDSYAAVTVGRTRVPALALTRLRSVSRDWEEALSDVTRQMDALTSSTGISHRD